MHRAGLLVLLLALSVAPWTVACDEDGERVGGCPSGESCDPDILGLLFDGVRPTAHTILPVAIGASEVIGVCVRPTGWPFVASDCMPAGAFDAVPAEPGIVSVTHTSGSEVTMTGIGEGRTRLRILVAGRQTLLDSIVVSAHAVVTPRLSTAAGAVAAPFEFVGAVFRGSSTDLSFTLVAAGGFVLWDDSIVTTPADLATVATTRGVLHVDAHRDAADVGFDVLVVDDVDAISVGLGTFGLYAFAPIAAELDGVLHARDTDFTSDIFPAMPMLCAIGRAGLLLVADAPVTFDVSATGELADGGDFGDCILLEPPSAMEATQASADVTVSVGSVSRTVHVVIDISPSASPLSTAFDPSMLTRHRLMPGARALTIGATPRPWTSRSPKNRR